jgi:hypothetical protein
MEKPTLTKEQKIELEKLFPFEYIGGGYFRLNTVPAGEVAPILHGEQAIEYLFSKLKQ